MNAMDSCCSLPVHFDTCNWDDRGNNTAQRYLDVKCAFPICLGKCDAQGNHINQPGILRVAVKKICMVLLVPNHRHSAVVAVSAATPVAEWRLCKLLWWQLWWLLINFFNLFK
jgi:hypothetical protein